MARTRVKFAAEEPNSFSRTVRSRVDAYFKDNNISKNGNANMVIKSITILAIYFGAYAFILVDPFPGNTWAFIGAWFMLGMGGAFIGLSIMHDANHGAYSTNKHVNKFMGMLLNLIGGYAENWKVQHNVLHHTFTNVEGLDEDIEPAPLLRFSPHKPLRWYHKFQFLYGWALYGLMTFMWITIKDFDRFTSYHKSGLVNGKKYWSEVLNIVLGKIFYYTMILVIPMSILGFDNYPWWMFVVGLLVKHYSASVLLACIFQPAHVVPTSDFPLPKEGNKMENTWMVHQMLTTADFSPKSRVYSWFIGGLNYQIEHHLFPNICHVHYKKIAPIVEKTAKEYGLPYNVQGSFLKALINHTQMLYALGRKPKGNPTEAIVKKAA